VGFHTDLSRETTRCDCTGFERARYVSHLIFLSPIIPSSRRGEASADKRIHLLGPLARIGPNLLVTDDVDLLRRMSGARSPYSRAEWYDGMRLDPRVNNVISERNDKNHNALRAKLASGVSLGDILLICIQLSIILTNSSIREKTTQPLKIP
jgi:hypothetical protein